MKAAKLRSLKFPKAGSKPGADDGKVALPFANKKKPKSASHIAVEGAAAKPRLDRPGRRMKRADGGPTISNDSKLEAYRLRQEDDKDDADMHSMKHVDAPMGFGIGTLLGGRGKVLKAIGAGLTAYGASNLGDANKRLRAQAERHQKIKDIEGGRAMSGEEDRKSGGRVAKKGK